jgi:hypothetical protein
MSRLQDIYAAPLPKKQLPTSPGSRGFSDPGERSERMTNEADIGAAVEANALPGKSGYGCTSN